MKLNGKLRPLKYKVFFDFDNTITTFDVLDLVIEHFSADRDWEKLEKDWRAGHIGAKECLEGQLKSLRLSRNTLNEYLSHIKLDPYFKKLLAFFRKRGIHPVILSDSFSPIIKRVLENNGIRGLKVYANRLKFSNGRLIPSFPFFTKECSRCAHCKRRHITNGRNKKTVYIGDGLSDICPSEEADLVFAKGSLLDHLSKANRPCVAFENLEGVYDYFKRELINGKNGSIAQKKQKKD